MRLSDKKFSVLLVLLLGCQLKVPGNFLDSLPSPAITSFAIGQDQGTIVGDTIQVVARFRWSAVSLSNLVASFKTTGKRVTVNDVTQISGFTSNDFNIVKTYVVTGIEDDIRKYTVTVTGVTVFTYADTGQIECSSGVTGEGAMATCPQTVVAQDAELTASPAARSFTGPTGHVVYTGDYVTKDNVTGLVWKTCTSDQSGPTCAVGGATYTKNPDTATSACTALNAANAGAGYAGITTWRLPSIQELRTLTNFDFSATSAVDSAYFPGTPNVEIWSATSVSGTPTSSWTTTWNGRSAPLANTSAAFVRCVAGVGISYNPAYTNNGDGTISDSANNLVWQKCSRGQTNDASCSGAATNTSTWLAALSYCQGLSLAGRSWRLPTATELTSIVDFSAANPAINVTIFPATVSDIYWTATTDYSTTQTRSVYFASGQADVSLKGGSMAYVRCIATGP